MAICPVARDQWNREGRRLPRQMKYVMKLVAASCNANSFRIRHSSLGVRMVRITNCIDLSPYHPPEFPNQLQDYRPPPEVVVEGEEPEFEVEKIVDSRKGKKGKIFYKVDWRGYGPHEMTWEPIENLERAKDAIKEFHKL